MKSQVVIAFDHTFLMTRLKHPFLYVLSSTIYHILPYIIHIYIYHISVKWPILIKTSPCVPAALQLLQLFVDEIPPGVLPARHGGRSTWAVTHPALVYIYIYIWNLMGITGWRSTYPSEKYESAGIIIPNIWKKSKCSKPPTIYIYICIYNYIVLEPNRMATS